jgi:uncharacterized protein YjiK
MRTNGRSTNILGSGLPDMNKMARALRFVLICVLGANYAATAAAATLLYAIDDQEGQLVTIDSSTGYVEIVGGPELGGYRPLMAGLAYDSSTDLLYGADVRSDQLIAIDRGTGHGTVIGRFDSSAAPNVFGLAYDSANDVLFGADASTGQLLTIDRITGAATAIGSVGLGGVEGLTYDSSTDTLFGITQGALFSIDRETGTATTIGSLSSSRLRGLAYDPALAQLYAVGRGVEGELVTVDRDTAAISMELSLYDPHGHAYTNRLTGLTAVNVVPIPAAIWLFASCLGLLGWMRRSAA